MKAVMTIIAVFLIIAGVCGLAYQGITYHQQEQVAQIGDIKVSADKEKTIYFPPYLGGLSLVAGIFLLVVARKNR